MGERLPVRLKVSAGLHRVGVTMVGKSFALEQKLLDPDKADLPIGNDGYGWPIITRALVAGPYESTGPGDTPTRRAIFTCRPSDSVSDTACADEILGRLALRAYGRPLDDQDRQTLREIYASGSDNGRDFEAGIEVALARILSGPEFLLYHGVTEEEGAVSGAEERDNGATLASRLALFLWNSIPDDALRDDAIAGRLADPKALEAHVRRMLADPRADTLVTDFAEQWLQLRLINTKSPDARLYFTFDDNLRSAMLRETELFLRSVLLDDASVLDLIRADYTFLNERLAKHYGIDGVFGDAFRRVTLQDPNRRGLLGQGSILFQTSVATRTSPVFRGKWILTNFFNSPPPPPPRERAGARREHRGQRAAQRARAPRAASQGSGVRRLPRDHRSAGARARELRSDRPLARHGRRPADRRDHHAAGRHPDLGSERACATRCSRRPELFVSTFTQKLMVYALGRRLEAEDMPTVRRIVREAAKRRLQVQRARARHRAQPAVPAEGSLHAERHADGRRHARVRCLDRRVEVMFITKKHLSRRTVLRGAVGAAISLPFLDAMVPAASAAPPAQLRFGAVYVPNGIRPEIFTPPSVGKLELPAAARAVRAAARAHQRRHGTASAGPVRPPRDRLAVVERRRPRGPRRARTCKRARPSTSTSPTRSAATRRCARSSSASRTSTARRTRASSAGAACT